MTFTSGVNPAIRLLDTLNIVLIYNNIKKFTEPNNHDKLHTANVK
jgi:hypothetical protein